MTSSPTIAFRNGEWVPHDSLTIRLNDLGFRQAVTAVERLRTYGGRMFQAERHVARWTWTTKYLSMSGLPDQVELIDHAKELLDRNDAFLASDADVGMTWLATPGEGHGPPTFIMHLQSLPKKRIQRYRSIGQPIIVTDIRQVPDESWSRQIKVRSRLHYYLADIQARQHDLEASGVLVDDDGSVTETGIANLAIVVAGEIISPPSNQVLPGITQQVVQDLAAESGITWREQRLSPQRLHDADDVLLMGTDAGLWRASQFGLRASGDPSKVFLVLLDAFDRLTGSDRG